MILQSHQILVYHHSIWKDEIFRVCFAKVDRKYFKTLPKLIL